MASSIPTNMDIAIMLTIGGTSYMIHHCWACDRFKCLIPTKKDCFRAMLTWMLLGSTGLLSIWASGFSYLKHKYWYMHVPNYGIMATPVELYTHRDLTFAHVLNTVVAIGLWLQVALNAEEGLYWFHLMRAVRQPRSARAWLNSSFFIAWVVICVATLTTQLCVMFVSIPDENTRIARTYASMGLMEVIVAISASVVIIRFPAFLNDVRRSGAGSDVRTRLYSFHEANKLRTFFRVLFSICAMILGFDGLTESKKVNTTRWAAESIEQVAYTSYFAAAVISIILYLPRTYSAAPGEANIMVGRAVTRQNDDIVSNALISLLREGGQWDDADDKRNGTSSTIKRRDVEEEPWSPAPRRNSALANFTTPFAVAPQTNEIPTEIQIHVKQEVVEHREGDDNITSPRPLA